jgi:predicted metal-dependent peptidase
VVRIQKARTALLLNRPFFGTVLFRLGERARSSIATMATDGVSLYFNPQFVDSLSSAELIGVLAHETMHPALQHHTRRGGREPKRWNMECDYAINPLLIDAGLTLPEKQNSSDNKSQKGGESQSTADSKSLDGADGNGPSAPQTPGGVGQVLDAPEPREGEGQSVEEQARDWQIGAEQAENVARLPGKMPMGAKRSVEASKAAQVDWRELLRRAWSEMIPATYSWSRPNRRHIWTGLYLPGVISDGVGEIAIAVDCSGSVNGRQLGLFERRSALSSGASSLASSTFCTLILKCRTTTLSKLASRSNSSPLEEAGRIFGRAFHGWRIGGSSHRRWSS